LQRRPFIQLHGAATRAMVRCGISNGAHIGWIIVSYDGLSCLHPIAIVQKRDSVTDGRFKVKARTIGIAHMHDTRVCTCSGEYAGSVPVAGRYGATVVGVSIEPDTHVRTSTRRILECLLDRAVKKHEG